MVWRLGAGLDQPVLQAFVIQGGIEVGTLLQVFLGIGTAAGRFTGHVHAGGGRQGHGGGNSGSGDDGEEVQIHVGNPCVRLVGWPGKALEPNLRLGVEP